jgi:hypothetical protein
MKPMVCTPPVQQKPVQALPAENAGCSTLEQPDNSHFRTGLIHTAPLLFDIAYFRRIGENLLWMNSIQRMDSCPGPNAFSAAFRFSQMTL